MIKSFFGKSICGFSFQKKKKKWNCDLKSVLERQVLSAHDAQKNKCLVTYFYKILFKPKTHNRVFCIHTYFLEKVCYFLHNLKKTKTINLFLIKLHTI